MNARWLSSMILLAACAEVRYTRAPDPAALPADALAVARSGGDPVSSLRATFTARAHQGDSTESVRGVLLVSRPQRFRMRLSSMLGFTLLDYTIDGAMDRLWLADERSTPSGAEARADTPFSPATARWIFLRADDRLAAGCRQIDDAESVLVECTDPHGVVVYRGYVRRGALLLEREVIYDAGSPRLYVEYAGYRPIAGVRLPYSIRWTETTPPRQISIEIDRYEVNPDLPAAMFAD